MFFWLVFLFCFHVFLTSFHFLVFFFQKKWNKNRKKRSKPGAVKVTKTPFHLILLILLTLLLYWRVRYQLFWSKSFLKETFTWFFQYKIYIFIALLLFIQECKFHFEQRATFLFFFQFAFFLLFFCKAKKFKKKMFCNKNLSKARDFIF